MVSGQQDFFLATWCAGYFFPPKCSAGYLFSHFSAGFFFLKSVVFTFTECIILHLHCGYCSNSSNMELESLKML